MWTLDVRCSYCGKKGNCEDRKEIVGTLSPLANKLNTEEQFLNSSGDGVMVVACQDFTPA